MRSSKIERYGKNSQTRLCHHVNIVVRGKFSKIYMYFVVKFIKYVFYSNATKIHFLQIQKQINIINFKSTCAN